MLRTRSPLSTKPKFCLSFDLHVLTMPPAFTLSQDQTLQESYATKRIGSSQINDSFIFSKKLIGNPFIGSHKITFKEQPSYLRERVPTNRESSLSSSEMIFFSLDRNLFLQTLVNLPRPFYILGYIAIVHYLFKPYYRRVNKYFVTL